MIDLQEKVGHITFLTETSAVQFGLIDWTLHIRTRLRTITDAMLRPESQYLSHGSILHEIFSVLCASCHSMEGFQGLKSWWFRDNALSVGTQTKKNGTKTFWERRNVHMGLVCIWIDWTRLKSIETDWNRLKPIENIWIRWHTCRNAMLHFSKKQDTALRFAMYASRLEKAPF